MTDTGTQRAADRAAAEALAEEYGAPEFIPVGDGQAVPDVGAAVYRDAAAADAWLDLAAHPVLAKVPLPDGRVVGITDLRPARERDRARQRRERLTAQYGTPEKIDPSDALTLARAALAPVGPDVTPDDVWAGIYRDERAADGWLESNLVHHGHPALAKVPLPDGRVIGILDLRPMTARARDEARR